MARTSIASMTINNVSFEWTEDSRRKERPCFACKKPTTGREDHRAPAGKLTKTRAACLACSMRDALQKNLNVKVVADA